jgi:hypothetical protein
MDFHKIKCIARDDEDLWKTLSFGFLRACSEGALYKLLIRHIYENPAFSWIFRCYLEHQDSKFSDEIARHFLSELSQQSDYHKCQTMGSCLDHLFEKCSKELKEAIVMAFLSSGKRYLRKYAYKKPLNTFSPEVLQLAYECLYIHPDEAGLFIGSVAYNYDDQFIETHFNELIKFPGAEEYQIRKLFARKANLSTEDWKWLESEFPDSILYVAAKRGHTLTDEECFQFFGKSRKPRSGPEPFQSKEFDNQDGLKFWCLAKLGKWEVINALLKNKPCKLDDSRMFQESSPRKV